jgi:exopolysaccharide biosynthesis polyprenyl glycosylphosphotransferase
MRNRLVDGTVRLLDIACVVAAVPAAYYARDLLPLHARGPLFPLSEYWPFLTLSLLLWTAWSWFFRVYESFRTRSAWPEIFRIARAVGAASITLILVVFFLRIQDQVSRLFFGAYFTIAFLLLATNRLVLRRIAYTVRRGGFNTRVFAVVGSGDLAHDVVATVEDHPEWGMQFAGHIFEDDAPASAPRHLVLGKVSQLGQILDDNVIDEVIFAVPRERLASVEGAFRLCQEQGAGARFCLDMFQVKGARAALGELDGLPMLSFSSAPNDEVKLLAKRAFDVLSSTFALVVFSPLLLATAVAVKLESPGPVFFRQTRVGLNGRPFRMFKFRSMHVDAEERLASLLAQNEASGPVFKMKNDPRVTRVGRFIRRTSIDELPQFLNVLAGHMSVVGPRPPIPAEVKQYQRWQRRRLSVKPGITCTWQVSGRSDISFDQWMRLDLEYIDHWSLWRDVQICFRTIPAVLTSRGAH